MTPPAHLGRRGFLFGKSETADDPPVRPIAAIATSCLALRGVACMSCRDACLAGAIHFALAPGGAVPRVEIDACTGCADCIAVCPTSAITIALLSTGSSPGA
jgi:ferredoxin-type protein NapF